MSIETPKEAARGFSAPMRDRGFKPIALHPYTDGGGVVLYYRMRLQHPDTKEKWIRPFHLNGNSYKMGEPKFPEGKPLYSLQQIANNPDAVIWIVEGEQKADALNKLGLIATTSGGATSAFTADWNPLRDRTVRIWPDFDEPGKSYAGIVETILVNLSCNVSCIDVDKLSLAPKEDCVNWLEAHPEATDAEIEALPTRIPVPTQDGGKDTKFMSLPMVHITCAADIKPEAIRWLWKGWLARGKFHIFAGQAGTGKTTIAIALASTVSNGGRFPDGTLAPVGDVLIWSGEDSAQDTLVPRLIAADADMNRIHFIGDVQHGDEMRSFDPATDIKVLLDTAIRLGNVSLLIVDPVVNAVAGDSHKNGEVRRALQPLVEFGEKMDCAVLGITHFSKGTGGKDPMERVTGSLAFAALARIVLATGKINDNGTVKRIFCRAKSNIGVDSDGFEYDLQQKELDGHKGVFSSYALWGQAVEGTATELLTETSPDDAEGANADKFLRDLLANGSMAQKDIEADCTGAGYSFATVKRAKKRIGVVAKKDGMKGGWFWSLPIQNTEEDHEGGEGDHTICMIPFEKNDPLREDHDVWVV